MTFLNWFDPCAGCYHCAECGRPTCKDTEASPRENEGICGLCAEAMSA